MAKFQWFMFILPSGNDMDMWNLQYSLLKTNKILFKEPQLLYKQKFKSYQIDLLKLIGVLNCLPVLLWYCVFHLKPEFIPCSLLDYLGLFERVWVYFKL